MDVHSPLTLPRSSQYRSGLSLRAGALRDTDQYTDKRSCQSCVGESESGTRDWQRPACSDHSSSLAELAVHLWCAVPVACGPVRCG